MEHFFLPAAVTPQKTGEGARINVIAVGLDWSLLYGSVTTASVGFISEPFLTLGYFGAVPVTHSGHL